MICSYGEKINIFEQTPPIMTPDKPRRRTGLDQLEPVLGEAVAQLDLHTAQLKRANNNITTLIEINTRQSDDISFLLRGQANQREQLAEVKIELAEVKTELTEVNARLDGFGQVLTAILNAVQKPSGN